MKEYLLIKQGRIHNAKEEEPMVADILIGDGLIKKIAPVLDGKIVNEAKVIDAAGLEVYPGFVEAHCHLGLDGYAIGYVGQEFNEMNDCLTPELSAIDGINPMDPTFHQAVKGGITCVATGPGSSNVLGGTFCAIKTAGHRIDDMIVREKIGMKCAFGENPKNCYKQTSIYSRMTIAAKLRGALKQAQVYNQKKEALSRGQESHEENAQIPEFYDQKMEALVPVVAGELPLKAHCHRADDIFTAIRIAREFHIQVAIDHCTDGQLIVEDLAREGISCAVGPSFGHASKEELYHKSFRTPGILADAGINVAIITDSPVVEQRYLRLCAAMAIREGMKEFDALKAITINAARHIGVEDRVGSIEEGKDGDLVIFQGSPFQVDSHVRYTIINGTIVYELEDENLVKNLNNV